MRITGIIAEYNPFHTGHKFQLEHIRKNDGAYYCIVVMSSDFVQRGTPAVLPKHLRARTALENGADLVLELPAAFCTASAEAFARGGVSLFNALGVVTSLSFGCETQNMSLFMDTARILAEEPKEYRDMLKTGLQKGLSFPAARSEALLWHFASQPSDSVSLSERKEFLSQPNNILGIEYCKALLELHSPIVPRPLLRQGSAYHSLDWDETAHPSASSLRELLRQPEAFRSLTDPVYCSLRDAAAKNSCLFPEDFDLLLQYRLLTETAGHLAGYLDFPLPLANRVIHCRNQYTTLEAFCSLLKTKELTHTGIRRSLLHMLLEITEVPRSVPYARILGFRKSAAPLLSAIKQNSSVPLISKLADASRSLNLEEQKILQETTDASNIYESVLCRKAGRPFVHEYQKEVILVP